MAVCSTERSERDGLAGDLILALPSALASVIGSSGVTPRSTKPYLPPDHGPERRPPADRSSQSALGSEMPSRAAPLAVLRRLGRVR